MSSTPYDRQNSFALFSAENPTAQQSGTSLDAEFNAVKIAIDDTQQNLALIQDDDGALKRGSVGQAQFDSSVSLGFAAPAQWESGVLYTENVNTVFYNSIFYIANTTHTSGVSFDASKWDEIADLSAAAAIPDGSITSAKLANGAVAGDKLADGVVANAKIATGAVSTNKIADQNVTFAKLAPADIATPLANLLFPAGMVVPFAGSAAPSGWLLCNGQSLVRAEYPLLFAAIGTAHGAADGTHFNVPDMRGRVAFGLDPGGATGRLTSAGGGVDGTTIGASGGQQSRTLLTANLPPYTPSVASATVSVTSTSSLVQVNDFGTSSLNPPGGSTDFPRNRPASVVSNGTASIVMNPQGGTSTPIQTPPPGIVLNYIIKAH
ncbi:MULTISPECIES: tail fiber protein [unclassified Bradyrhizobium]|uniref:tail fiber protein n=1 Tax=unclassified Bradyrhizobium TaxID=2631580 RepID=UPI002304DC7E|nr:MULTISPECIES: tail fiber protein [unclassified Bradyrhizobium]